jgi:hypothetical protein
LELWLPSKLSRSMTGPSTDANEDTDVTSFSTYDRELKLKAVYTNSEFSVVSCRATQRDQIRTNPICVCRGVTPSQCHMTQDFIVHVNTD